MHVNGEKDDRFHLCRVAFFSFAQDLNFYPREIHGTVIKSVLTIK